VGEEEADFSSPLVQQDDFTHSLKQEGVEVEDESKA